ncbi:hypothetical protein MMC08_003767, partial [Hypocenomyce scalaris]|nr:hypothetical protein [Hypocenomyce scalaris]
AGKSHLARQYVNKNRKKFDGGIFWINARLREEIYQAYWNIAQKVVLRDSPHLRLTADGKERCFEDVVKTWFEARRQWLIVFDGIAVDKDDDAAELQSFIPDSEDSSIIYVSRASNLGTKQRLLRPFPIKVHALKEDDARKLLFKELHIKKPTEAEVKSAAELVKKMGGLPLAIHAISHRLGATYNGIMDDLQRLGHQGAWNLVNLICFYGPHLPVELIRIGIKVLRHCDIEVKSSQNGEKPDLNTTFGVLMRYALIERNEPDEGDSASSSRDSLIGPEPIDMLKMHSVAQKFCCDALNAANILPQWLGYAVDVFCESFRQADGKIKAKPQAGRVSDYREYLVHGKRLLDHSKGYETKTQNLKAIREKLQLRLSRISEEIETRQPGSSQESVRGQEFQVSIFDRTSSTSDSAASEHEVYTPNNRPYPLSTHESLYGGDLFKEHVETPTSMHSNSPSGPIRIVDNSPRAPFLQLLDDEQYDTDRDEPLRSHPMHHNVSDATARPRAPSTVSQDEGWQTVPPSRRTARARDHQAAPKFPNYGRPRPHRDLGSFRPTPARAELAGVSNVDAVGSFSQPRGERLGNLSGSSDAVTSLSAVHHSSPPPSRGGRSISQQRSPSRPPAPAPTQPTYAGIVAGQPHRPVSSQQEGLATGVSGVPGPYPSAPVLSAMQRGRSRESLQGRAGNLQPSPLAAEFRPHENITQSASNENSPFVPPLVYQGSAHTTPDRSPGLHYVNATPGSNFSLSRLPYGSSDENNAPHFQGPVVAGPNPADLPLEENISITPKRRAPADFRDHYPPFDLKCYHTPPSHQAAPLTFDPYQVPYDSSYYASYYRSPLPAGWGSQPMTRANSSRQSHSSVAATDPILYNSSISPRFSPYISGLDLCPRDRNADGRPPSKSPKHYHAFPVPTDQSPQPGQAREYTLSGTGGWAGSPKASPTSQAYDAAAASMSRTGSGPGVAVGEPGQMEIAEFGGQFVGGGQVQFGAHPPVVFEEGRSRVREWERRLRESERGGREEGASRRVGRSAPYPSRNRIPTEGEDVVMGEVGGGARTRGVSAPGEGRGGLGLGIGMEFQL